MLSAVAGSGCHGLESIEDQVSADISNVVEASKPDLMARGTAFDLLQMAKRVGPQCEAAEHKDLFREENFSADSAIIDDLRAIKPFSNSTEELLMKEPMSVSKPVDLG